MSDQSPFSRRSFFTGSTAGALATLGSAGVLGGVAGAAQAATQRGYTDTGLALEIDGAFAGLLKSATGTGPTVEMVSNERGAATQRTIVPGEIKHQPVTITFAGGMSSRALDWFCATDRQSRNVTIVMYNTASQMDVYRLSLSDALVTQFALPRLDARSAEPIEFSVTLTPTQSAHQFTGGKNRMSPNFGPKYKNVQVNGFAFFIDKLESTTKFARTVEGIAVNRKTSVDPTGRALTREAGLAEFSTFDVTIPLANTGPMYAWFAEMGRGGSQRPGQLQLLGQGQQVLATVDFTTLFPVVAAALHDGGDDPVTSVKLTLCPSDIRLNLKALAA